MTFPPQCTKRWQLYDHMSRVLKMCEEAGFDRPWECVRFCSDMFQSLSGMMTELVYCNPESAEFALVIVESRPVFRDSEMFDANVRADFVQVLLAVARSGGALGLLDHLEDRAKRGEMYFANGEHVTGVMAAELRNQDKQHCTCDGRCDGFCLTKEGGK